MYRNTISIRFHAAALALTCSLALRMPSQTVRSVNTSTMLP
jgi:hypothetical protein